MCPSNQSTVESYTADQDELTSLFSEMLGSPKKSKDYLLQALANVKAVQSLTQPFPGEFNIRRLKFRYKQQAQYILLFPTVFTQLTVKTHYAAIWRAKFMLKWAGLPFVVGTDNLLHLKTVSYTKVSLLLQMLIYQSDNQISEPTHLVRAAQSATAVYLSQQLGASYSEGQLIDFVDRLYDQYKHTKLSPYTFRHLFRCFGCHTPTIANAAFDHYMHLRNTENAWQLAVVNFLQSQLSVPKFVSQTVANLLCNAFPFSGS